MHSCSRLFHKPLRLIMLVFLLLLGLLPGLAQATDAPVPVPLGVRIEHITFRGNTAISSAELDALDDIVGRKQINIAVPTDSYVRASGAGMA